MTTYSPALASQVGSLLSQLVPGMPASVATAWATLESGVGNNPYGVESSPGVLATYSRMQAGVQAAANLLLTSPSYSGIRSALTTGEPTAVASAIVASPWNTPNSAYYASGFTAAGIPVDLSTVPVTGTSTSYTEPSPAAQTSVFSSIAQWLGISSSTTLTTALADEAATKYGAANANVGSEAYSGAVNSFLTAILPYVGQAAGNVPLSLNAAGQNPTTVAAGAQAGQTKGSLIPNWGAYISDLGIALVIIVAALALGFMGVQRLLPAD
jgi:hypothetical protein